MVKVALGVSRISAWVLSKGSQSVQAASGSPVQESS